jgi:cellulose synthase/poly-beta-1,6-N-acetylglucosamine synthase-like glycosyltransferase
MIFIDILFLSSSLTLTLLFFLYGFNHYYVLFNSRRYIAPPLPASQSGNQPLVAIHLPVYNEKYVVSRLVAACARMAEMYGIEKVKIVLIDDSDDDTIETIDQVVAGYIENHYRIEVLRRGNRQGFKAGALQAALESSNEEYIAVFDADFTPPPNFLNCSLPYFLYDERLGVIQSRWTHINRDYNPLTWAIALGIDVIS